MSEAQSHIEQMQQRLEKAAAREQVLIDALNDALERADRKLLDDVRSVASDHEARRAVIFTELQSLADRICAFPMAAGRPQPLAYEAARTGSEITVAPSDSETNHAPARGGDWRKAAEKISKDLESRLNRSGPTQAA